jgi:hypothetical protein
MGTIPGRVWSGRGQGEAARETSGETLITAVAVTAAVAASSVAVIAVDIAGAQVPSHGLEGTQQLSAELSAELNLIGAITILEDAMRGGLALQLFH